MKRPAPAPKSNRRRRRAPFVAAALTALALWPGAPTASAQLAPTLAADSAQLAPAVSANSSQFAPEASADSAPLVSNLSADSAQLAPDLSADSAQLAPDMSADEARALFARPGYAVSDPSRLSDGIVLFGVSTSDADAQPGWPTLRVLVFADAASAAAHRRTHGPQLLSGYGASTLYGNLALAQLSHDPAAFPPEPECVPDPVFTSGAPQPALTTPTSSVDAHFIELLSSTS